MGTIGSPYPANPVLLVDDEPRILTSASAALAFAGIDNVITCEDSRDVSRLLEQHVFSAVSLDLVMPHIRGEEVMGLIRSANPQTAVIIATGLNDVERAVELMKRGALDYMVKPLDSHRLVTTIRRAIETFEVLQENIALRTRLLEGGLDHPESFDRVVTVDTRMQSIFRYIEAVATTSLPVLITGETGVGKELLAEAVHRASARSGEFIPINTAGLDDQLFADTLFGHVKGAYTGAAGARSGAISKAAGGTLFLDEIGDLGLETQVKLLRLVQEREYYPLGSDNAMRSDARFVFATNRDLQTRVNDGEFRQDLYYRLKSHHVIVPPLRDRRTDVPILARLFLEHAAEETGKPVPELPEEFDVALARYDFPGNVRELQGVMFDAMVRHRSGLLSIDSLEALAHSDSTESLASADADPDPFRGLDRLPRLKDATEKLIAEALRRSNGNQTAAASLLGMNRSALSQRLSRAARRVDE